MLMKGPAEEEEGLVVVVAVGDKSEDQACRLERKPGELRLQDGLL
jgi:hypothetical protein